MNMPVRTYLAVLAGAALFAFAVLEQRRRRPQSRDHAARRRLHAGNDRGDARREAEPGRQERQQPRPVRARRHRGREVRGAGRARGQDALSRLHRPGRAPARRSSSATCRAASRRSSRSSRAAARLRRRARREAERGHAGRSRQRRARRTTSVAVTLVEYSVTPDKATVPAGTIRFIGDERQRQPGARAGGAEGEGRRLVRQPGRGRGHRPGQGRLGDARPAARRVRARLPDRQGRSGQRRSTTTSRACTRRSR